jgi:hypothetical protein
MVKRWRNHHELDALRSYTIELLVAHIQDKDGPAATLEDGLLRFFLFVAQSGLEVAVSFPENGVMPDYPDSPVVVLDPVNSQNNIAFSISTNERGEIVGRAQEAWETLTTARWNDYKRETVDMWREVFGQAFLIEETTP